jgi:tetratricopeptide (TPR) repeat protein
LESTTVFAKLLGIMLDTSQDLLTRAAAAKREGCLTDARRDAASAAGLLRQQPPGVELANALRLLAEVERKLHQEIAARQHYEEAVDLCHLYADPLTLAHTVRHLGDLYYEAGQTELAQPCYREALNLYRSEKNPPPLDLANAIRSSAILAGNTGEREQAKTLWQEARDLYALVNVPEGVKESSRQLAQIAG